MLGSCSWWSSLGGDWLGDRDSWRSFICWWSLIWSGGCDAGSQTELSFWRRCWDWLKRERPSIQSSWWSDFLAPVSSSHCLARFRQSDPSSWGSSFRPTDVVSPLRNRLWQTNAFRYRRVTDRSELQAHVSTNEFRAHTADVYGGSDYCSCYGTGRAAGCLSPLQGGECSSDCVGLRWRNDALCLGL